MADGPEFDTIRMLMDRWGPLAADIGDDAALLAPMPATAGPAARRVISTDACIENVHFRAGWLGPREIGARAATAALSDLAAMGARAEYLLVALVVPERWRAELAAIADGVGEVVGAAGARIIGGNLSRGEQFAITTSVIGTAERPVSRSGARVGDVVLVTGVLGGPGAALRGWERGGQPSAWARARFASPVARLVEGQALAAAGVSAMIDLSDGLAADARHLAAASGVSLTLDPGRLPVGEAVSSAEALISGEEYELLVTLPSARLGALLRGWSSASSVPLTVIGEVREASTVGERIVGHDHFADDAESPGVARTR